MNILVHSTFADGGSWGDVSPRLELRRNPRRPAFFSRELFAELTSLRGDQGARRLSYPELIAPVPFLHGAIDIDTPEVMTRWRPFPFTPGFSPVERQHCIIEKPFKRFLENAPARSPG